ncbi:hypothetical protein NM688_g2650 [Phlebia brevispora]|uniref:Uncharacterized protein n=1 Tax=Phlebia brevispora TaxID=194682 RepID=A0ACC1T7W0_9APHY|nr:hypothetical protein NM688_g2650 [Phlebia brevispora]
MSSVGDAFVFTYPEKNPFQSDPPIARLVPEEPKELLTITPQTASEALAKAEQTGVNPLSMLYGDSPLSMVDPKTKHARFPIEQYTLPPPLVQIFPSPVQFIEWLNPEGRTPVYKVQIGEDIRLLKLYTDRDPDEEYTSDEVGWPMFRFRREKEAYAHLLHSGACAKGIVPHCYGWFDPKERDFFPNLLDDRRPPKAILLEYFPEAEQLSVLNITSEIADKALRGLYEIHASYVLHGDINKRNVLVLSNGRVVWIDFDESTCGTETRCDRRLTRQKLLEELSFAWIIFYPCLMVDKRLEFRNWLY